MKLIILTSILLAARTLAQDTYSAPWLKDGLTTILLVDAQHEKANREKMSEEQWRLFYATTSWLNGFIVGANALGFSKGTTTKLAYPPDEWLDVTYIAPKILLFMKEHDSDIHTSTPARLVMLAWYYSSHPDSTDLERYIGERILGDQGINSPNKALQ